MNYGPIPLKEFIRRCPNDIELLTYTSFSKPCTYRCIRCSKQHTISPAKRVTRRRVNCKCNGEFQAHKLKDFLKEIKHLHYLPLDYKAVGKRCNFKCTKCGTLFDAIPNSIRAETSGCKVCKNVAFAEEYDRRLAEEFPHITCTGYTTFREECLHRCTCGNTWMSKPFVAKTRIRKKGCSICDYKSNGPKLRSIIFDGQEVFVQGYEDYALEHLEKRLDPSKLLIGCDAGVPKFKYEWSGKQRLYYPDFFYKPNSTVIEVKSLYTLLTAGFEKTCAKARAVVELGYKFKLLVIHVDRKHGEFAVLTLPKTWHSYSKHKLMKWLCLHNEEYVSEIEKCYSGTPWSKAC